MAALVIVPAAPMAWSPPAETGTVKVEVQAPVALTVILEATVVVSKVILAFSPEAKPEPETLTVVPAAPLVLLIVIPAPTLKARLAPPDEVIVPEALIL